MDISGLEYHTFPDIVKKNSLSLCEKILIWQTGIYLEVRAFASVLLFETLKKRKVKPWLRLVAF